MTEITLKLDEKLAAELTEASQENGIGLEDTARSMIERALRTRRFDRARQMVLQELGNAAPKTDAEAFERLK